MSKLFSKARHVQDTTCFFVEWAKSLSNKWMNFINAKRKKNSRIFLTLVSNILCFVAFSWKLQSRSLGARWTRHSILFYSYTCCMQENCHHGQAKWPSLPWVSYGSLVECLKYSSEGRRFHSFREHSMFSPSMPVSFTKSFTNLLHTRRIEMSTCGAHMQWWCEWRWLILILVI